MTNKEMDKEKNSENLLQQSQVNVIEKWKWIDERMNRMEKNGWMLK
jgi:hypothetical protein